MLSSQDSFSQYFTPDDEFLALLESADDLPGGARQPKGTLATPRAKRHRDEPPPPNQVQAYAQKRYRSPEDGLDDSPTRKDRDRSEGPAKYTDSDAYDASTFGGFGQYMHNKRRKLQIQNDAIAPKPLTDIFKGVAIYVNGWTKPSIQELRELVVMHGGVFQPYLDRKSIVTHVITTEITAAKMNDWKNLKVVTPAWIEDSVRRNSLQDWTRYMYKLRDPDEEWEDGNQGKPVGKGRQGVLTAVEREVERKGRDKKEREERKKRKEERKKQMKEREEQSLTASGYPGTSAHTIPSSPKTPDPSARPRPSLRRTPMTDVGNSTQRARSPSNSLLKPPPSTSKQRQTTPSKSKSVNAPLYTTDPTTATQASRVPGYASHSSNPYAKKAMQSTEFRETRTSVSEDFIEGYYKNSRLHYLSTWKAELKNIVAEAQDKVERGATSVHGEHATTTVRPLGDVKGKGKGRTDTERVYMHCDFDSFFVAVGRLDRPHLVGKPVVVCHSQGGTGGKGSTSEVASASYEAREKGVRNGMSLGQARKLCPEIETVPYQFERYKELSFKFYSILMSLADDIQAVSVDEALIDATSAVEGLKTAANASNDGSTPQQDFAKDFAESLRKRVKETTGCEISIGISHNIMLSRLATRRAKPAGSFHLTQELLKGFLANVDIGQLHGFGHALCAKAEEKFQTTNLKELGALSKSQLCRYLGPKTGETIWNAARGVDHTKLESDKPRKSVSCDINFGIRFENNEQSEKFIHQMAVEVSSRLSEISMKGRHLTMKIMKRHPSAPIEPPKFLGHGHCDVFSKSTPIAGPGGVPTADSTIIGDQAWRLLSSFKFDPKELRGLAIQVQKLEGISSSNKQSTLMSMMQRKTTGTESQPPPPPPPVLTLQPPTSPPRGDEDVEMRDIDPEIDHEGRQEDVIMHEATPGDGPDPEFLAALPPDLRAEVERQYAAQKASMLTGHDKVEAQAGSSKADKARLARITRALGPKGGPLSVSPVKKETFFKKKLPHEEQLNVPRANLISLGIDPDVFEALPLADQKEQLAIQRGLQKRGDSLFKNITKVDPVGRLKKGELADVRGLPQANNFAEVTLVQKGRKGVPPKGLVDTSEIQDVITSWIESFLDEAPREKDVGYFAKFLVECVDSFTPSETPLCRAVHVLKWWRLCLRQRWPEPPWSRSEGKSVPVNAPTQIGEHGPGEGWWLAFWEVKTRMDSALRPKYGGIISLK